MSSSVRQRRVNMTASLKAGGLFFAAMMATSAADPAPASAISIPGVDQVTGAIGDAIGSVGGGVLKDALQYLFGGFQADITAEVIKFLTRIELPTSGSLSAVTGPLIVIGGFFLVVGLITSVGDGYREVIAGTDTAPRVIGQAIFRVIGLALLMGSWFWLVPLAVDMANHMSSYVLSDHAVHEALRRSFVAGKIDSAVAPILWVLIQLAMAMVMLILIVLKFIMVILFACVYVGGPVAIGMGALPRIGPMFLGVVMRALLTLTIIPLVWTIVFAAWAGVAAGTLEALNPTHFKLLPALMGPGLFIAGAVVLLAITRRLFAMATAGMRMSLPGAGMARAAITMAIGRALGAKMIEATGTIGKGQPAAAQPGEGMRSPGDAQYREDTAARQQGRPAQTVRRRPLSVADERTERAQHGSTRRFEAEAALGNVDSRTGAFRKRDSAGDADISRMVGDVEALRSHSEISTDQLDKVGDHAGVGDRSGAVGAALQAKQQYPTDPERARMRYQQLMVEQYAGRRLLPDQQEAINTITAARPETVIETYEPHWRTFDNPPITVQESPIPGRERDPWSPKGRQRMKDEYDRRKREERNSPPEGLGLPPAG